MSQKYVLRFLFILHFLRCESTGEIYVEQNLRNLHGSLVTTSVVCAGTPRGLQNLLEAAMYFFFEKHLGDHLFTFPGCCGTCFINSKVHVLFQLFWLCALRHHVAVLSFVPLLNLYIVHKKYYCVNFL